MSRRSVPPTWDAVFVLRDPEAKELVADLTAKGFLASAEATGRCSTIDGEHVHLVGVRVYLTPAQARRLAGPKK